MNNIDKLYTGLCVLFTSLIIVGNLTYQKFVTLQIPHIHVFELSVGAILYPLTFLITDLITEFFGKERATFCVRFSIIASTIIAVVVALMCYLPATSWSKIDDAMFSKVFGSYGIAFICSLIACYIGQSIDILLYLWIKKATKDKHLWLRNNVSTAISLFIDTTMVISLLTLFGIIKAENTYALIANSYSWKLFFTICSTPIFYVSVSTIRVILNRNNTKKIAVELG